MTGSGARAVGGVAVVLLLAATGCSSGDRVPQAESAPVQATSEPVTATQNPAKARYVSPSGDDDSTGSARRPWRTLSRALPALVAGDTLYVREGTYREQLMKLTLHEGTLRRPIVVAAYPGEGPVVKGRLWLQQPVHWTIDGIDVTRDPRGEPSAHMVKVTGGVGWTWRNSEIWGAHASANVLIVGTESGEPRDWSFTDNCVHDLEPLQSVQQGSNIAVGQMRNAGPGEISRNLIYQKQLRVRNLRLGVRAQQVSFGPRDLTVTYNTIYGGAVAITLAGGASGIDIERNLLADPASGTLIRANQLRGTDNTVQQNLGVQAERFFRPVYTTILDRLFGARPGNVMLDVAGLRDTSGCAGFEPTTAASAYGRDGLG